MKKAQDEPAVAIGAGSIKANNSQCLHMNFHAQVNVGRLTNDSGVVTSYTTDITVKCADCNTPLEFVGLPLGSSPYHPTVSMDGLELQAPITPQGTKPPDGLPGYSVTMAQNPNA
jgi:hypothetical protein